MNRTPTLHGDGVRLTPLCAADISALNQTHDPSTWQWMSESGATPDLMQMFVQRALSAAEAETALVWTTSEILPSGSAVVAGSSRIADWNRQHRTGEIGWTWIAPHLRQSGFNLRVKLLQLHYCFTELQLRRVALKTHHANIRSQRAIEKLGATYEGRFRNHMIMPDGTSRDTLWYSITDEDWPRVEASLRARIAAASTGPAA